MGKNATEETVNSIMKRKHLAITAITEEEITDIEELKMTTQESRNQKRLHHVNLTTKEKMMITEEERRDIRKVNTATKKRRNQKRQRHRHNTTKRTKQTIF